MDQKIISLTGQAQVLEHEPEELSEKVMVELIELVQRAEKLEKAKNGEKATDWAYRVPFAGVRYFSYE
jgi:hypothetical protein